MRVTGGLIAVMVWTGACGGSATPTSPSVGSPATPPAPEASAAITVSVAPTPLVAVPDPGGAAERYRVTANVTFQETAGRAATVTALLVTMTSGATGQERPSWAVSVRTDTALSLAARGTASYTLVSALEAPAADTAARWRLDVVAADQDGRALSVPATETLLTVPPPPVADVVFVGAGDMAGCGLLEPEATARLLDRTPGTVFTAGDNVYPAGTPSNYAQCYGPTWGRHLWRTFAAPGNHDWYDDGGASYFDYFGAAAGPAGLGYYSHTLGAWHVVVLNSNLRLQVGTPQYEWLRADLAAVTAPCAVAIWHHPLFSSGENGNSAFMRDAWRLLMEYGVELAVTGHDHVYERFAPQDADGRASARGIRQFVVGTGGYTLYKRGTPQPNSEVFDNQTYGVLKLTLSRASYAWEFLPIDGQVFRDAGSAPCLTPAVR